MYYCGYDRKHSYETLETWICNLEHEAKRSFANWQVIGLLGFCSRHGYDTVKKAVRSLQPEASVEDIAELIESIIIQEKEDAQFIKEQA